MTSLGLSPTTKTPQTPQHSLDRHTRFAARLLAAPTAFVSLDAGEGDDGLVVESAVGTVAPLAHVAARRVRATGQPLAIDAAPAAFLGVPLTACDGRPIGCLGVVDVVPRAWSHGDVELLAQVAASVSTELQLRATLADRQRVARLEAALAHQAHHDALTGLANRAQLGRRVERALEQASHSGRAPDHVAVLVLDLDGFKHVNDAAGHAAGDALLRQVAARLLAATRGSDLVARLGGDEFGVLLERVRSDDDLVTVADRILHALHEPFAVPGATVVVGASIGIARGADRDAADPVTSAMAPVDTLLRNAELALYEAKGRGKGQHALFEPALHAAALERVSMEAALRRALDRGELRLAFQPIVELGTGRLVSVEALARWSHPERGVVPPAQFIALAEETGLIVPLGRWVLGAACREGARWAARADGPLTVAVNVSGRQLQQPGFVDEVAATLAESGLPASSLVLELTESTVIQHPEVALERLTALKALGVRLAVDDFGTGYSALSHLQRYPFDALKIDKSFVDHVADGGQSSALAGAIVALSDALSLRTVAEGVETRAQQDALAAMGCGYAQGFLFAQPVAAAEVDELLEMRDA